MSEQLPTDIPLQVQRIDVVGNKNIKTDFIQQQCNNLLNKTYTINELTEQTNSVLQRLRDTTLIDGSEIIVDKSSVKTNDSNAIPIKLLLKVQEHQFRNKGWIATVKGERSVNTAETSAGIQLANRNVFGRNETIDLNVEYGNALSRVFTVGFNKPISIYNQHANWRTRVYSDYENHSQLQSLTVRQNGIQTQLSDTSDHHNIQYTATLRDITPLARIPAEGSTQYTGPSVSIYQSMTTSLKSSLKYIYTRNDTDSILSPTQGTYTQYSTELAGLGGDVKFIKNEIDVKHYIPINDNITAGFSLLAGTLYPFSSHVSTISKQLNPHQPNDTVTVPQSFQRTHIIDRFLLGGPMLLRGFAIGGVGPHDGLDALGGDIYTGVSANVTSKLPFDFTRQYNVRAQAFVNAGNLVALPTNNNTTDISTHLKDYVTHTRVSAGIGLYVPTPFGRLDFSFAIPVNAQPGDQTKRYGWGLGLKFL